MPKNDQKEQNGYKKLKIHKNQIIYLRVVFPYDGKKARRGVREKNVSGFI
ncbi:hypothetical protein GYO_1026 [Bacillus spizizenii TU-B-10]|uniref:Uncharacterized protein n=1 Tax=Bacillus spizizenii (strain DSM 15029 / JCM 12233 / NBRC 101239 / NRRL B-23049 / TU-B-10) TaxID=1052585 RepID=G4NUB9_BACS4|nr:hypothetical protein GYO_1026 [Bacillus spizizenii TU-B-10]GEK26214.1 hypothetical protein BSU04nite_26030 [Bacillus spizizenii]